MPIKGKWDTVITIMDPRGALHIGCRSFPANSTTDTVSVLGQDEGYTVKYSPPPEGFFEGGGLYLTVYPQSSPNTGSISFLRIIIIKIPS